jgi:hypothetical protein
MTSKDFRDHSSYIYVPNNVKLVVEQGFMNHIWWWNNEVDLYNKSVTTNLIDDYFVPFFYEKWLHILIINVLSEKHPNEKLYAIKLIWLTDAV